MLIKMSKGNIFTGILMIQFLTRKKSAVTLNAEYSPDNCRSSLHFVIAILTVENDPRTHIL